MWRTAVCAELGEEWRAVCGWLGYEVSSLGRVRSVNRVAADGLTGLGENGSIV